MSSSEYGNKINKTNRKKKKWALIIFAEGNGML